MSAPEQADVVVIGAGVAGLAAAFHLARRGAGRVVVLEREAIPGAHASGRNAAMFHAVLPDAVHLPLALESRRMLLSGELEDRPLLEATGSISLFADAAARDRVASAARAAGLSPELLDGAHRRVPALASRGPALWSPWDGVIDIQGLLLGLLRGARVAGAEVRFGVSVRGLFGDARRVTGVDTDRGRISAGVVVNAAGAWARGLGGGDLPLESPARHLVWLAAPAGEAPVLGPGSPLVWDLGAQVYCRHDSGGVLASPCDDRAVGASIEPFDALESLAHKLSALAPALAAARVRRTWTCRRTLTPDGRFVVGRDPVRAGLYWLSGLGGRGMTAGPAAGRVLADLVGGAPELPELSPARFGGL